MMTEIRLLIIISLFNVSGLFSQGVENDFEQVSLDYFIEEYEMDDSVLSNYCLIYPDSMVVSRSSPLLVFLDCFFSKNIPQCLIDEESTIPLLPAVDKVIDVKGYHTPCENPLLSRKVQVLGARLCEGNVYVEIALISLDGYYGESVLFKYNADTGELLDTCITDWAY